MYKRMQNWKETEINWEEQYSKCDPKGVWTHDPMITSPIFYHRTKKEAREEGNNLSTHSHALSPIMSGKRRTPVFGFRIWMASEYKGD